MIKFLILVPYDSVLRKVKTLDTAEASEQSDIPTKILKRNSKPVYLKTNISIRFEIT